MIIDCDPGVDDAMAIIAAARWADLVGITTVAGNVPLEHTTANACRLRSMLGLDVEVHAGADGPLVGEQAFARHVHGETGLGDVVLPEPDRGPDSEDAVAYLVETTRSEEGLHLVPIGPLTNVALALRADPGLAHRVASITLMGGSALGVGNVSAAAEFNVFADPEAADQVFRSGAKVRMLGLNLTHQVRMGAIHAAECRTIGSPVGDAMAGLLEFYTVFHLAEEDAADGPVHDPCAVLAVTHPELFTLEARSVQVELAGTHTRGMTLVDERGPGASAEANCQVAYGVDADAVIALIMAAVREA
jgi:inosine-uridine nucleoside N-ribohydrolase|tara:strand:- start:1490 stop:2401 length:912 start_codon:yes stop_codon:yes gene_type:complete